MVLTNIEHDDVDLLTTEAMSEKDASVAALRKTKDALKQIKTALAPFLKLLKQDSCRLSHNNETKESGANKKRIEPDCDERPKLDAYTRAEAEAAVACKYYVY